MTSLTNDSPVIKELSRFGAPISYKMAPIETVSVHESNDPSKNVPDMG